MPKKEVEVKGLAKEICIWKDGAECADCDLKEELFCKPELKYAILFGCPLLIAVVPIVIEVLFFSDFTILLKLGFLGGWLAYAFFFLNVWESRMLCNHCPYYANEKEKTLHCPIDRGKLKTGKYDPGPSSTSERVQFIIGVLIFIGYPVPFLILGKIWFSLIMLTIGVSTWIIILQLKVCTDCVNFACPLNRVPKSIRDEFLKRNPVIKGAWERKGHVIE